MIDHAKIVQEQCRLQNEHEQQIEQQQQEAIPAAVKPGKNNDQATNFPKPIQSMILGSSIIKHVRGGNIKKFSGNYSKVCSFPGAGSEKVTDHAEVELKYAMPKAAIIHCGGNDLANDLSIEEITNNIKHLGCEMKHRGVAHIAISSMVPRTDLREDIPALNDALRQMCSKKGFDYINNKNIYFK